MEIIEKVLTIGTLQLPLADDLSAMMTAVKSLSPDQHALIVRDAGLEAPDELPAERVLYTALSVVQNAWYQATKGAIPPLIVKGHEDRVARHLAAIAEIGVSRGSAVTDGSLPELPVSPSPTPEPTEEKGVYYIDFDCGSIRFYLRRPGGHAQTIEELRERHDITLYRAVLSHARYQVPEIAPSEVVYPLAAGVVSRWWHEAANKFGVQVKDGVDHTLTMLSENAERDQRLRYQRCLRALEAKPGPTMRTKPAKDKIEPSKNEASSEARVKLPKQTQPLAFRVKTPTDELKASVGQVYAAVVKVLAEGRDSAGLQPIIDAAVAAGFTTKEPAGPAPRIRWLALELVKKGVLEVVA